MFANALIYPFEKHFSDCTIPCSSIFKEALPLEDTVCVYICVCAVYFCVKQFLCSMSKRSA